MDAAELPIVILEATGIQRAMAVAADEAVSPIAMAAAMQILSAMAAEDQAARIAMVEAVQTQAAMDAVAVAGLALPTVMAEAWPILVAMAVEVAATIAPELPMRIADPPLIAPATVAGMTIKL